MEQERLSDMSFVSISDSDLDVEAVFKKFLAIAEELICPDLLFVYESQFFLIKNTKRVLYIKQYEVVVNTIKFFSYFFNIKRLYYYVSTSV